MADWLGVDMTMVTRPSGWQRRKLRAEAGLPLYTEKEAEGRRAYQKQRIIERRNENAVWLAEYKVARGCVDCGYRGHAEALEFDHLPGFAKRADVAALLHRGKTRNQLLEEINKCELVCANCHRVRTASRRVLPSTNPVSSK